MSTVFLSHLLLPGPSLPLVLGKKLCLLRVKRFFQHHRFCGKVEWGKLIPARPRPPLNFFSIAAPVPLAAISGLIGKT
jgi:hypothetical protein